MPKKRGSAVDDARPAPGRSRPAAAPGPPSRRSSRRRGAPHSAQKRAFFVSREPQAAQSAAGIRSCSARPGLSGRAPSASRRRAAAAARRARGSPRRRSCRCGGRTRAPSAPRAPGRAPRRARRAARSCGSGASSRSCSVGAGLAEERPRDDDARGRREHARRARATCQARSWPARTSRGTSSRAVALRDEDAVLEPAVRRRSSRSRLNRSGHGAVVDDGHGGGAAAVRGRADAKRRPASE